MQAMTVLEAAAYDVVLVETVGVGQSEVTVAGMVDTFLFLTLARTGDQLQGIKKGILEIADVIAVNKADGDREQEARGRRPRAGRGAAHGARQGGVGPAGRDLLGPRRTSASTTCGSGCCAHREHLGEDGLAAQARRASSSTSPGRWCATSSPSGCGAPPACAAIRERGARRRAGRRAPRDDGRRPAPRGVRRRARRLTGPARAAAASRF